MEYQFFGTVFIIIVLTVLTVQLALSRWLRRREAYINDIQKVNPVLTQSPLQHPKQNFRKRAKRGLKKRFSIFTRLFYVLLILLAAAVIIIPYIDKFPQAIVSIIITSSAIIIGIAGKPIVENFLSGIVITFSKKINIGDTVLIDDHYGTIEDITSTSTVIKLWDWRRLIIPNTQMLTQRLISYTLFDSWHWSHVEFTVEPSANLKIVKKVSLDIAKHNRFAEAIEEPSFWVMETHREYVKCWVAVWTNSPARSWELRSEILSEIIISLSELGIHTHANNLNIINEGYLENKR